MKTNFRFALGATYAQKLPALLATVLPKKIRIPATQLD
jgi:hypothetical protein